MQETNQISDKTIRKYLLADERNDKVVIKRDGSVVVRTTRQRGDGGRVPWWMFAGYRRDIAREIAHEQA